MIDLYIDCFDYFVLIVVDIDVICMFYQCVLGMQVEIFGSGCIVLCFGLQKINLYVYGCEFELKVVCFILGLVDLCLIIYVMIDEIFVYLYVQDVCIEDGLVQCIGVIGLILLVYFCDLDGNLIEVLCYLV